jgi:hypothetical protein
MARSAGNTATPASGPYGVVMGPDFAPGFPNDEKLQDVLATLDEHALSQLVQDHEQGHLEGAIASTHARVG